MQYQSVNNLIDNSTIAQYVYKEGDGDNAVFSNLIVSTTEESTLLNLGTLQYQHTLQDPTTSSISFSQTKASEDIPRQTSQKARQQSLSMEMLLQIVLEQQRQQEFQKQQWQMQVQQAQKHTQLLLAYINSAMSFLQKEYQAKKSLKTSLQDHQQPHMQIPNNEYSTVQLLDQQLNYSEVNFSLGKGVEKGAISKAGRSNSFLNSPQATSMHADNMNYVQENSKCSNNDFLGSREGSRAVMNNCTGYQSFVFDDGSTISIEEADSMQQLLAMLHFLSEKVVAEKLSKETVKDILLDFLLVNNPIAASCVTGDFSFYIASLLKILLVIDTPQLCSNFGNNKNSEIVLVNVKKKPETKNFVQTKTTLIVEDVLHPLETIRFSEIIFHDNLRNETRFFARTNQKGYEGLRLGQVKNQDSFTRYLDKMQDPNKSIRVFNLGGMLGDGGLVHISDLIIIIDNSLSGIYQ